MNPKYLRTGQDNIRDPQPPTAMEEMTEEEREAIEAAEYEEADNKIDADYYRRWDENA